MIPPWVIAECMNGINQKALETNIKEMIKNPVFKVVFPFFK